MFVKRIRLKHDHLRSCILNLSSFDRLHRVCIISLITIWSSTISAQVTVTVTGATNTSPALSTTYTSLANAINALNSVTSFSGPVILSCASSGAEIVPAGGYSLNFTGATTMTNSVTITGNSTTLTASAALTTGSYTDAIFKIIGCDFITIQGFTMLENSLNTALTPASNNMTEYGVAVFYSSVTDGAQNITIQNNNISLNKNYINSFGIYSTSQHSSMNVTSASAATSSAGANSNLNIYSNTISNINQGIYVVGSNLSESAMNLGLDIGGSSSSTGNTIQDFGVSVPSNFFTGTLSTHVCGIYVANCPGYNVQYNSVSSSSGLITSGTIAGVMNNGSGANIISTYTQSISNNLINILSGNGGSSIYGILIPSSSFSHSAITQNISNNLFTGIVSNTVGPYNTYVISNSLSTLVANINSNIFQNLSSNSTGSFIFIEHPALRIANGVYNINNNVSTGNFTRTGIGTTTIYSYSNNAPATARDTNVNNNFSNFNLGGSSIIGWQQVDGGSANKLIANNTYSNWSNCGQTSVMSISSITGSIIVKNNTISNIAGSSAITGISLINGSDSIINNSIDSLISTASASTYGIYSQPSSGSGPYLKIIANNQIYAIINTNSSGTVGGIGSMLGANIDVTYRIYNNIIGDLKTPNLNNWTNHNGMAFSSASVYTNHNVIADHNTIYLSNSSSALNYGTHCIAMNNVNVTLRNNLLINLTTPLGGGYSSILRGMNGFVYNTSSNNNVFWASSTGSRKGFFFDNSQSIDSNFCKYQRRVYPSDTTSVTNLPTFLSTTSGSTNYLRVDGSIPNLAANIGMPLPISIDLDGNTRNVSTPDAGAHEFAGSFVGFSLLPKSFTTICGGNSVAVTASSAQPYTYTWSGTGLNTTSGSSVIASPSSPPIYHDYIVTAVNGAISFSKCFQILVNPSPSVFSKSPSSVKTCLDDSIKLFAVSNDTNRLYIVGNGNTSVVGTNNPYRKAMGATTQNRVQYLVTKSEMNAMGMVQGDITSLAFDIISAGSSGTNIANFEIKIGHTSNLSTTSTYATPIFTSVFSNPSFAITTTGWFTHLFATPFYWNGVDNLIIEICQESSSVGASDPNVRCISPYTYNTACGAAIIGQCTNTGGAAVVTYKPNMRFGFINKGNVSWSPTAGLFSNSALTTSYSAGSFFDTLWCKTTNTTKYYVTSTLGTCTRSDSITNTIRKAANNIYLPTSSTTNAVAQCVESGWTYYGSNASQDSWLFAIRKNSTNLTGESVAIEVLTSNPNSFSTSGANREHASLLMMRSWDISGSFSTGTADVRFFFDPQDSIDTRDLRDILHTILLGINPSTLAVHTPFQWFKTVGVPYNAAWRSGIAGNWFPSSHTKLIPSSTGSINSVRYVQFDGITSFSGGTGGAGYSPPLLGNPVGLPVKWKHIYGQKFDMGNQITWITTDEENVSHYELEYSIDAIRWISNPIRFSPKGSVPSLENIYTHLHETDEWITYYRVKQIDHEMRTNYSKTIMVLRDTKNDVSPLFGIYPNPIKSGENLRIETQNVKHEHQTSYQIVDMLGREIYSGTIDPNTTGNRVELNLENLSAGIYSVVIKSGIYSFRKLIRKED